MWLHLVSVFIRKKIKFDSKQIWGAICISRCTALTINLCTLCKPIILTYTSSNQWQCGFCTYSNLLYLYKTWLSFLHFSAVTLISGFLMFILFVSELSFYLSTEVRNVWSSMSSNLSYFSFWQSTFWVNPRIINYCLIPENAFNRWEFLPKR